MKTGLVLEGGAVRTIFSSGVCDGFLDAGIPMPDHVVGVSAGIAYGISYVSRQRGRNLEVLAKYANDKRYMGMNNLLDPFNRAYFGLRFGFEVIPDKLVPFDRETYNAFPGRVEAGVTNLETGLAEFKTVDTDDKHATLLKATCAMPLLFPVFEIDGQPYLDGGAAAAIPYQRALDAGCDRLVVILTRERSYRRQPEKLQHLIDARYRKYPKFCDVMRRRHGNYNADRERLFQMEKEGRAFVFAPESTEGFSRVERDMDKIRALWQAGVDQAAGRREELLEFLRG